MQKKTQILILLAVILAFSAFSYIYAADAGTTGKRIVANLKDSLLPVGTGLVVVSFLVSGIMFLVSGGNPLMLTIAKGALITGGVGTAIILSATSACPMIRLALGEIGFCAQSSEACNYAYSGWGSCENGKQKRTIISVSPEGCVGEPGSLEKSCQVACTDYKYSDWGSCENGKQKRTLVESIPPGCTGSAPGPFELSCVPECQAPDTVCGNSDVRPDAVVGNVEHCYAHYVCPAVLWEDSKKACNDAGGHLVTITSMDEQETVLRLKKYGWIGLEDKTTEGIYKWVNGEEFSYSSWNSGQPNNSWQFLDDNADCVENLQGNGRWNDYNCANPPRAYVEDPVIDPNYRINGYICEFEPIEYCERFDYSDWGPCKNGQQSRTVINSYPQGCTGGDPGPLTQECSDKCAPDVNCGYGGVATDAYSGTYDHCYAHYTCNGINYESAESACSNAGGHLVTITSQSEQDLVWGLKKYGWIGLNDKDAEGSYKWVTGEPFSYRGWANGQPDNVVRSSHPEGEDCAENFFNGGESGMGAWNDYPCSNPTHEWWPGQRVPGFICEFESTAYCPSEPDAVISINGRKYEHFTCPGVSYNQAQNNCESSGGYLVTITSYEEQQIVTSLGKYGWIGLNDKNREGNFEWVTGEQVSYLPNWGTNNPDNTTWNGRFPEGEDCVDNFHFSGMLADYACSNPPESSPAGGKPIPGYICEIEEGGQEPPPEEPPPPECESGGKCITVITPNGGECKLGSACGSISWTTSGYNFSWGGRGNILASIESCSRDEVHGLWLSGGLTGSVPLTVETFIEFPDFIKVGKQYRIRLMDAECPLCPGETYPIQAGDDYKNSDIIKMGLVFGESENCFTIVE